MAKLMDLRRLERLIELARRKGVTRLSITDNGVELELGTAPAQAPRDAAPAPVRRRVNLRDAASVDDYLRARLAGSRESS